MTIKCNAADIARIVTGAWPLDLDHFRAKVAEYLRSEWGRQHSGQIQNFYPCERGSPRRLSVRLYH
jgi:hypothetical protein